MGSPFPELPGGLPDDDPVMRRYSSQFLRRSLDISPVDPVDLEQWITHGCGPHPQFDPAGWARIHDTHRHGPITTHDELIKKFTEIGQMIKNLNSFGFSDDLNISEQQKEELTKYEWLLGRSLQLKAGVQLKDAKLIDVHPETIPLFMIYIMCKARLDRKTAQAEEVEKARIHPLRHNYELELNEWSSTLIFPDGPCYQMTIPGHSSCNRIYPRSKPPIEFSIDPEDTDLVRYTKNLVWFTTNPQTVLQRIDTRSFYIRARKLGLPPEFALRLVVNSDFYSDLLVKNQLDWDINAFPDPQGCTPTTWSPKYFYSYGYPNMLLASTQNLLQQDGQYLGRLMGLETAVNNLLTHMRWIEENPKILDIILDLALHRELSKLPTRAFDEQHLTYLPQFIYSSNVPISLSSRITGFDVAYNNYDHKQALLLWKPVMVTYTDTGKINSTRFVFTWPEQRYFFEQQRLIGIDIGINDRGISFNGKSYLDSNRAIRNDEGLLRQLIENAIQHPIRCPII